MFPRLKNIWAIFHLLALLFFAVFLSFSIVTLRNIEQEHIKRNSQSAEIISSSLHSVLAAQESMLNLLGTELVKLRTVIDKVSAPPAFDQILGLDPSVAALGLLTPDGAYRYITNNADIASLPNLLAQPESRASFQRALEVDKMVLGRTYYFKPIGKWIIPLRKAIRDRNGKVIAVVAAALDLRNSSTFSSRIFQLEDDQTIEIIRNFDSYLQHSSHQNFDARLYEEPREKSPLELAKKEFDKSINKFPNKFSKNVITLNFKENNKSYTGSFKYDQDYELWTVSIIPTSTSFKKSIILSGIYFSIYLLTMIVFYILFRSVSRAEEATKAALIAQANSDFLTGLPNRNYLHNQSQKWIHEDKAPFSLLYVDMDNFKNVNDSYGHLFGDQVLKEIAKRITSALSSSSLLIRYGGDEFVILSKITDEQTLLHESHELTKVLSKPYHVNGHDFVLGASIGIARYPDHATQFDALIRMADLAMYESKKYRNKASLYLPGMEVKRLKNIRIEQQLRTALERQEIFMMYQPQIDSSGLVCGVESLVRWQNPTLGFVPPDQFISIAEESGQMGLLGDFILETSLEDIDRMNDDALFCPAVSINISVKQFLDPDFILKTYEAINRLNRKIDVCLEITESLFIEDLDYVLSVLNDFHKNGVKISLDDFGTGYSSLGILKKLPIDELKIDKSFIDEILTDDSARKMIKNIIDIGKNLNLNVLAEGVETFEQKRMLEQLGCDRFQGYYFSKPLKPMDLTDYIRSQSSIETT